MGDDDTKAAAASNKKEYGGVRGKYAFVDYAFEFLSDTFRPILWALLGASLVITLLVLFDTFGIQAFRDDIKTQPPVFQLLHATYQSVFYFLPIMVGACAARKLGRTSGWVPPFPRLSSPLNSSPWVAQGGYRERGGVAAGD